MSAIIKSAAAAAASYRWSFRGAGVALRVPGGPLRRLRRLPQCAYIWDGNTLLTFVGAGYGLIRPVRQTGADLFHARQRGMHKQLLQCCWLAAAAAIIQSVESFSPVPAADQNPIQ